jgi:hypothetical protein
VAAEHPFSGAIDSLGYRLFSIPGAIDLDVSETLEGELQQQWGVYADNGRPADYFETYDGSEAFRFRPGRGFWILARTSWTVPEQTVETAPLDADGRFELSLQAGWNIIASPFSEPVPWALVRAASPAAPTARLWGFDGAFEEAASLEPYRAYYYFNDEPAGAKLAIPYPGLGPAAASKQASQSGASRLRLEASGFDSLRTAVEFMIDPGAETGKDRLDQYAPRNGFSRLSLLIEPDFEAPYGFLALDARPAIGEGVVYNLVLDAQAGERIALETRGLESFGEMEAYFVDGATGEFIDLHEQGPVWIHPAAKRTRSRLVIGTAGFVERQRALLAPETFVLQQNYPNPFGGSTTLGYSLPEAGYVEVQVYNVLGQEVARLVGGIESAGFHQIVWDGASSGGADLPDGVYLVRMRTENGPDRVVSMTRVR